VDWWSRKVAEHEHHVKVLQSERDTLQMAHFHLLQRHDQEWRVRKVNEALGGGLQQDVASERHTRERQFSVGPVKLKVAVRIVLCSLCDFDAERLEFFVQLATLSAFLLFLLNFVLVSISRFAFSVSRLVKRGLRDLPNELHVLINAKTIYNRLKRYGLIALNQITHSGLLLPAQHDGSFEMNVNDDRQFVVTWLEEEMLDIAEQ